MKTLFVSFFALLTNLAFSQNQKELVLSSSLDKVTVFFQGAQLEHSKTSSLKAGKQTLVFEKITDFLDPNSIQVKATGSLTILSVSARKNFEDKRISNAEIKELNAKLDKLYLQDRSLRDEFTILQTDKNLLKINSNIRGNDQGVKISELKEAYSFIHARMVEISKRESEIEVTLISLNNEINKLEQEISSQRSKPVINYSEILVEVDVQETTTAVFTINYITPNATWKPYYDLRSNGVGMPVKLEAKAFVNQTTGIEWKEVDLVLSTNDPYQNSKEPDLEPWYVNYNNYPNQKYVSSRTLPVFDYSGQKIRGEVIDASTGESMAFAKIYFSSYPNLNAVTDFDGKFEITVPKGEKYLNASYIGYDNVQQYVNAPYVKFFLSPQGISLEEVSMTEPMQFQAMGGATGYSYDMEAEDSKMNASGDIMELTISENKARKKGKVGGKYKNSEVLAATSKSANVAVQVLQKDLRVEYLIQSKFSLLSDGMDQRVAISSYELPANYEYHAVPKIDPSVYLVAQVSGWEKLNLLNGESNIYFDGTFIGKSYVDVNSTKDTLSFSLGKDSKVQVLRTRISEKSKSKTIGSRQKFDIAWELKVKNNGGAEIPLMLKDQFPVSTNEDIKVKRGDFSAGKLDDKTGIITWNTILPKGQSKSFLFDYSVDYQKGVVLYLE
ncbi:MAG: mucoidy inhibitor MuiA family protein [Bacteroidota bacterium]